MGHESSKARARRMREGYFERIFVGRGIDIGCGEDPVTDDCLRWDLPQGDAQELPGLQPASFDWVYSSHCLEDLVDPGRAVRRWWEVLRPGGYLLIAVPDEDLYEQGVWPSRFNAGHLWSFTIHKETSGSPVSINLTQLLAPLPDSRLLWLRTCDAGYDYEGVVWDRTGGLAEASLEALLPEARGRGAVTRFDTAQLLESGIVCETPLSIYTGILGQIGDILMFTATPRRLKEIFPRSRITFAVSARYREAGELVAGLPIIDRLFVTECYFERMTEALFIPWHLGWPADLRGEDEVAEQRRHDLILETRPRHRRMPWWKFDHQVAEVAHMVGVPGPIDRRTEIAIPAGTRLPADSGGRIVLHNDPSIDATKAWPWESVRRLVRDLGEGEVVLLGGPGPSVPGAIDLRGMTTLAEAAAVLAAARAYVGIDSGLMWIAGSLGTPTVGLYGTSYIPGYGAICPENPNARYLQVEGALDRIPVSAVHNALRRLETGRVTDSAPFCRIP